MTQILPLDASNGESPTFSSKTMPLLEQPDRGLLKHDHDDSLVDVTESGAMEEQGLVLRRSSLKRDDQFNDRFDSRIIMVLVLWYFWSALTLFINKYLIDIHDGDTAILSCIQMTATMVLGYFQQKHSFGMYPVESVRSHRIPFFSKNMIIVGCLRFSTVFLGLYALKYVEVSFTETVKSTAPAFTLIISAILLGEQTSMMVKLSILPVMGGLALCSASEAKFNMEGFIFALATNLSECIQNVLSKKMLGVQKVKYNPGEIQFHSGLASMVVQLPTLFLFSSIKGWEDIMDPKMASYYLFNGICYHCQTLAGVALMDAISPVTHSVANTLKRALLIWASVIIFRNQITLFSGIGTTIVFLGVLVYNKARQY